MAEMSIKDISKRLHASRPGTQADKEVRLAYSSVFSGDLNRKVLTRILVELHFFNELKTEEEVALHNYAVRLLNQCGVLTAENVPAIVNAIMNISQKPGEKNE